MIKYQEYVDGKEPDDEGILMSLVEYQNGGKDITGIPLVVTPDGESPVIKEDEDFPDSPPEL